jgi:hypothetical protein
MAVDVITFAGATISISAGSPSTYDETGFVALSYTTVGELVSMGDRGRTYTDVSYTTLADRGTAHLKGSYDEPETTFEIGADRDDAGQVLMKTASTSDSAYAFKVAYSNGEVDYFQGLVFSFVTGGGDANTIRMVTANVRIDRQGVVEVAAP